MSDNPWQDHCTVLDAPLSSTGLLPTLRDEMCVSRSAIYLQVQHYHAAFAPFPS